MPGQLVDAVKIGSHGHAGAACEHVGLQVGAQGVGGVGLQRARRDDIARPGQHGCGNEQRFVLRAFMLDDERFTVRFRHVGKGAVGVGVVLLQMIERGVERSLIAVAHDLREQRVELCLPEAVFGAAARGEQGERQADELVGVRREAFGDSRAHKSMRWDAENPIF